MRRPARLRVRLLALLPVLAALAGCLAPGAMTVAQFKERCVASASSGDCDPSPYCEAYAKVLERRFASRAECAAQCGMLDSRQWLAPVSGPCPDVTADADDWCRQFCNRNYPK